MKALMVFSLAIVICLTSAFGCPKGTAYHDSVVAEHDFKLAVGAFQQAEIAEFQSGRIDPVEHAKLETGISKMAMAGQELNRALQSGAVNTTVSTDFQILITSMNDLLSEGVLGIKNQTSLAVLKVALETAEAILLNASQQFQVTVVGAPAQKKVSKK